MSSFETRRFAGHGLTLAGDVGGPEDAPTVVLMHGGGQTRHSWAGTMDRLVAQGYHVVNLDARGHGESDWAPDGNYRPSEQALDLKAVLSALGRPVALVGASMGGMTAFHAIGTSKEPIADALVMVDIVLRPAEAGAKRIAAFMRAYPDGFATVEEAADAVSAYYPERPRPKDVGGLRKNLRLREDGRFRWHWDPRILDMGQRAEPPGPFEALQLMAPNVTLPTLLVRGGKSDIVDDEGVADMLRLVPQTEIFNVAGAGHMVAGDMNDPFSSGVIAFLQRHLPLEG
ncbi:MULTISPECIES: alpha/beta fold hydrolase [unclassified Sphingomonas]|uniref:alpha/beta fold hydrolase n=1 Tax=unclassified Sphingomonas TaxID=196159 RepID=UPI0007012451|nr:MULTISPECIES: alpha/beta fold hydrolase [unclassified Sphingomonas]KQX18736.1 alpha/beta hydrolase [Sphingomonas sp. Root1294]KQY71940.1 alpha/beta hydrolase [Sphingomonas sp. Root50]KRB94795.1 alpha/beta hydrolase [Sphingomonas sp. Root720]